MQKEYEIPRRFSAQLQYIVLPPLFFLLFVFVYQPFRILEDLKGLGGQTETFHLLMMTSITIVTLAITRLILWALRKKVTFSEVYYLVWCVLELVAVALFMALYLALFMQQPYLACLSGTLKYVGLTLIYPYAFLLLRRAIVVRDERLERGAQPALSGLFKFYDDHKRLKFTIDPGALLYIGAESNYIKIYYLENSTVKEYLLRASMKSLEESAPRHGLVRCHRSYYLNPKYVKVLGRNAEGLYFAQMAEGTRQVPVSKQYFEAVSALL